MCCEWLVIITIYAHIYCGNYSGISSLHTVAIAAVVSGVLSAVGTAVVTCIITWCAVVKCRQQAKPTATSFPGGEKAFSSSELTPMEYEVPVLKDQSIILVGDNVAYGSKIKLQQNVANEQVHTAT